MPRRWSPIPRSTSSSATRCRRSTPTSPASRRSWPGSFCAGADVEEIARVTDPLEAEAGSRVGHRLFAAWEGLPFPTVAAIRGVCLGGGLEIALASTWRVASDRPDTRMGLPEVQLGILPARGGSARLPRLIRIAEALDLILTGQT